MTEHVFSPLHRGDVVTVIAFHGRQVRLRVWEESGHGVLLCSERQYQHTLRTGQEPLATGFPKQDIVEVIAQGVWKGEASVRGQEASPHQEGEPVPAHP